MKEKLNERLLGLDLRPQSSGPSREVQTTFNPFETTAAAFTHILGKLARRLSGATLYIYKCVKRPVSGFFCFFFPLSLSTQEQLRMQIQQAVVHMLTRSFSTRLNQTPNNKSTLTRDLFAPD